MSTLRQPLTSSSDGNHGPLSIFASLGLPPFRKKTSEQHREETPETRTIYCNDPDKNEAFKFARNITSTTKFTFITFIPKALFEQFRRAGYWYFTVMAVLSLTPVSPYTAVTVILPLVLVLSLAMAREAWEDCNRARLDAKVNARKVQVHDGSGRMEVKKWRDVRVGDVLRIEEGEFFPADLVLLSSSGTGGVCYVETRNLDGETNLKSRQALEETWEIAKPDVLQHFSFEIVCEGPNASLYTFVGTLNLSDRSIPLTPQHLLLRDSCLQNTDYVYGVVVYTGRDTKSMQNSTPPPSKRSDLDKRLDTIIWGLFLLLTIQSIFAASMLCLLSYTVVGDMYYIQPYRNNPYYSPEHPIWTGILALVTSVILFGYLIPIALYVSLELTRVLQAFFIGYDLNICDAVSDIRAKVKTAGLNEELGRINIILSDKTGTLTCNQMDFLRCSIAGVSYGSATTEVEQAAKKLGIKISSRPNSILSLENEFFPPSPSLGDDAPTRPLLSTSEARKIKGYNFSDLRLENGNWVHQKDPECIRKFFEILSLCHTAIPYGDENGEVHYRAESPDESAFVVAARELGFVFHKRSPSLLHVRETFRSSPDPLYRSDFISEEVEESEATPSVAGHSEINSAATGSGYQPVDRAYELKAVMQFTSARKRMSVITRHPDGKLYLLMKGADSVVFPKLSPTVGRKYASKTFKHLTKFGEAGLRTLVLAYREIKEEEYLNWKKEYDIARSKIGPEREDMIQQVCDTLERDLILVGGTGVEDKLQQGVPECIFRLSKAGINMWVLTGDKVETAVNIGYACSLLRSGMELIEVVVNSSPSGPSTSTGSNNSIEDEENERLEASITSQIENGLTTIKSIQKLNDERSSNDPTEIKQAGLIIDGLALSFILSNSSLLTLFVELASLCASVICCRVSPRQKAQVTMVVREKMGEKKLCLAIGDGANDVGMIQAADVGVGINGVEGAQAAMAADYSIAQFRFLERLLLVHGHWCYRRISLMIMYSTYKVMLHGMTLFYSSILSGFSGQPLIDDWYSSFYNTIFTALPICIVGVLDQDVSPENALNYPGLYQQGQTNSYFKWEQIWLWSINGAYSSLIVFFLPMILFATTSVGTNGKMLSMEELGTVIFSCLVWVPNLQLMLAINYFTWIHHLSFFISIALWYVFLLVYGSLPISWAPTGYKVFVEVLVPNPSYWLTQPLVIVISLLPYFVYRAFQQRFKPYDYQLVLEEEWSSGKKKLEDREKNITNGNPTL